MALGIGFSTAITPLVAESHSEQNFDSGKSALKHGFLLCSAIALVLFVLILLAKPLMYSMDQPEEVVMLALPYLDVIAVSLIPLIIFQALKQFSDGLSLTRYPMYVTIIANIINVFFNYVLIFGKWGFPQMGSGWCRHWVRLFLVLSCSLLMWFFLKNLDKTKAYLIGLKLTVVGQYNAKKNYQFRIAQCLCKCFLRLESLRRLFG
jgi:MATE family multidrug resistance protein